MLKSLKKEALIVILGSFSVTAYLVPFFYRLLERLQVFRLTEDYGIVSWVTLNSYPIRSHLYYYVLAFVVSTAFALFFYVLWITTSSVMARHRHIKLKQVLRIDAYTYFFGIFGLLVFFIDDSHFFKILPIFISLIFVSKIFIFSLYKRLVTSKILEKFALTSYMFIQKFVKRKKCPDKKKTSSILSRMFFFLIFPVILYFLLYNPGLHERIDLLHEGEHLDACQKVMDGQKPYKDFYVIHGLLNDVWLPYLGLKLFGNTLEGYRKFHSAREAGLLAPIGYLSYYFLCLILFRRKLTVFLAMILLFSTVGFKDISGRHIFPSLALISLLSFLNDKKSIKLFAAGILSAFALIYSIEYGIMSFGAISLFLIFYCIFVNRRAIGKSLVCIISYIFGFAAGISPLMLYLIKNQALATYLQMTFRDPLLLRPFIWGKPYIMNHEIKYVAIVIYLLFVLWHLRNTLFNHYDRRILKSMAVISCGIVYYTHALITPDSWHIKSVSYLAFISLLIPAEGFILYVKNIFIFGKKKLWQQYFVYNLISILCFAVISIWVLDKFSPKDTAVKLANKIRCAYVIPEDSVKLDLERMGNIRVAKKEEALEIQAVVNFIQTNTDKGDYIYDFGNRGLYYYLAERKNPTRFALAIYASSGEQQEEVVQALIKYKPRYVISEEGAGFEGIAYTERFRVIWAYIDKYYHPIFKYNRMVILKYRQ